MCKKICTFVALNSNLMPKQNTALPEGHHNLDIIASYCGYDLENYHHALADAEACAWIAREIL